MALIPRFLPIPDRSFFLFGPRGTGKTIWLRAVLPDALFVNLLRPELYREMIARPERLRELVLGNLDRRDVVVDEVQRVPELLHVVHDLLEAGPAPRFVLTGSSARKLRRGGVDLLAGRAGLRTLHPFMARARVDRVHRRRLRAELLAHAFGGRSRLRRVRTGRLLGDRGDERGEGAARRPARAPLVRGGLRSVRAAAAVPGEDRLLVQGIRCVPVAEFLAGLRPGRGLTG